MQKIILGDIFDRIKNIPDGFADIVFLDPPYKKTSLEWDRRFSHKIINDALRVCKETGVVLVFGREPELSFYRVEAVQQYKYDFIWKKNRKNGYLLSKYRPLQETEKIAVFSKSQIRKQKYIPQFLVPCHVKSIQGKIKQKHITGGCKDGTELLRTKRDYPTDIIECDQEWKNLVHPTEKPIQLFEYLILTYSQLGDVVLDCCFGSGNSLLAANGLHRNFIGIEKEEKYFSSLKERLESNTK